MSDSYPLLAPMAGGIQEVGLEGTDTNTEYTNNNLDDDNTL